MTSYVIDTSVYIGWMRNRINPAKLLFPYFQKQQIFHYGLISAEVLRGIRIRKHKTEMETMFSFAQDIPTSGNFWNNVANLAWEIDRTGNIIPLTDITIAYACISSNCTLVTLDKHFLKVPGLKTLSNLPDE